VKEVQFTFDILLLEQQRRFKMSGSPSALEARRYSAEELLSLRTFLPALQSVISELNKHPDFGMVFTQ